jgi:hypothetical protein
MFLTKGISGVGSSTVGTMPERHDAAPGERHRVCQVVPPFARTAGMLQKFFEKVFWATH